MRSITLALVLVLSACAPRPITVHVEPGPFDTAPPGSEPFGYWSGDQMTVALADSITDPCLRAMVLAAAEDMGQVAGVHVTAVDYVVTGKDEVGLDANMVLVMPDPSLDPRIAAQTTPAVQSGGWIAVAWIGYQPLATCSPRWLNVLKHEFGHALGLQDTRDMSSALMHWQGSDGDVLRPWELAHLRRRIVNE